jgi:hypothetical protein
LKKERPPTEAASMPMIYLRRALPRSAAIVGIALVLVLFRAAIEGVPTERIFAEPVQIIEIMVAGIVALTLVVAFALWFLDLAKAN